LIVTAFEDELDRLRLTELPGPPWQLEFRQLLAAHVLAELDGAMERRVTYAVLLPDEGGLSGKGAG
jgi:hypothetical protein